MKRQPTLPAGISACLCLFLVFLPVPVRLDAQGKIAWVNSATILDKLPEAQDAYQVIIDFFRANLK